MIPLAAFEEIIDASGTSARIEAMLPIGVRARQLLVRTLLLGMLLVLAGHRPGPPTPPAESSSSRVIPASITIRAPRLPSSVLSSSRIPACISSRRASRDYSSLELSACESSSVRIRMTEFLSFGRSRVTVFHTISRSISK
jgi:hypothetical protein